MTKLVRVALNEGAKPKKRVFPYPYPEKLGYLYGEPWLKIKKISDVTEKDEKEGTFQYVTVWVGKNNEEVDLWREEGVDEWYDENGNATYLHMKKRKRTYQTPYYD